MTYCAYSCVRYILIAKELGTDTDGMYPTCGLYKVAGEALSSKEHARTVFANARGRYYESLAGTTEIINKRQKLDELAIDLEVCSQLRRQHQTKIEPQVKKFLQENK